MGETMAVRYVCPCIEQFRVDRQVDIDGLPSIPQASIWRAEYRNTETGALYLVNAKYHGQLAVQLLGGAVPPDAAILQFRGTKRSRKWALADPSDSDAFKRLNFDTAAPSWRLQYIGPDKAKPSIIRFSIEELIGYTKEQIGQIEYTHDLDNGPDLVIRGMRIRVVGVARDGQITYSILSEPAM